MAHLINNSSIAHLINTCHRSSHWHRRLEQESVLDNNPSSGPLSFNELYDRAIQLLELCSSLRHRLSQSTIQLIALLAEVQIKEFTQKTGCNPGRLGAEK